MTEEKMLKVATKADNYKHSARYSGLCKVCNKLFYSNKREIQVCSLVCRQGKYNGAWKGGRNIQPDGYVKISGQLNHPRADRCYRVAEHILIMERYLGRYLTDKESIHHKNGIKSYNRIENLELWSSRAHKPGQRVEDLINFVCKYYRKELIKRLKI